MPINTADVSSVYFTALVLIVFLLFFSMLLFVVFLYFHGFVGRSKKEEAFVKEENYNKALKLLEDARLRSLELLDTSSKEAAATLSKAQMLDADAKQQLESQLAALATKQFNTLDELSKALFSEYKRQVEEEKRKNIETLSNVSHDIENELVNEVKDFKNLLQKETIEKEKEVETRINADYSTIEKEMNEYRQRKLAKIDENIYEILADLSKQILGKALNLEDHQNLVLKILEDIKSQGVVQNGKL